ncbi:hypothetical protein [Thalassobacillus hwangdonensis]|uniref:ABC-2 family transporter protein n=1 Tax=Thalassobacillus hwangdonensis TaxID=546108 RepID=A0ABW3L7H8_9BACI
MSTWSGLWFKEWKMMQVTYLVTLSLCVAAVLFGPAFLGFDEIYLVSGIVIALLVFMFPALLMTSLNKETDQLAQFLHTPVSGMKLIGVKFLQSGLVVGLLGVCFSLITILTVQPYAGLDFDQLLLYGMYFLLLALGQGLTLAIIVFFLWVVNGILRVYIGGVSIAISIGIFILMMYLEERIAATELFQRITTWGELSIPASDMSFIFSGAAVEIGMEDGFVFMLGVPLFWSVILIAMFALGLFLLDRKVEV